MQRANLSLSRRSFLITAACGMAGLLTGCNSSSRIHAPIVPASILTPSGERWAASTDLNITIHSTPEEDQTLTLSGNDFKPSWSPDGRSLTFFRATSYGAEFKDWRSQICVINADGSGLRELTTAAMPNFNPTWTRDGSNRIIFNRLSSSGNSRNQVYWTSPEASPGDEQLLSDPDYAYFEWANSGLRDGRLFVDRLEGSTFKSFLLTPRPGQRPVYEEIERPTDLFWHKLSVSPSETRVAYMLDYDNNIPTYNDSVISYAEFDVKALKIRRPIQVTPQDLRSIQEYPAWNHDESLLVFDSNETGTYQVYAYHLADGVTTLLSPDKTRGDQFAAFASVPK